MAWRYNINRQANRDIKDNILGALDAVEASGSFASSGEFKYQPDSLSLSPAFKVPFDIHVRETEGIVEFPLNKDGVKKIASQARAAPYGEGSKTIVDKNVRHTWELDAEQFELRPKARFDAWWKDLLGKVAEGLGVDAANMIVHRYKMLLYPSGGMFKAHTDSEKEPGMFGTLVLSLPSYHKGGDVLLRHAGHKMTYNSSNNWFNWAAWYSDVRHEVRPVEKGLRWVLTFNLCTRPSPVRPSLPSAPNVERHEVAIHNALVTWLRSGSQWPYLLYELDHDYTEASVELNTLKGRDRVQARLLDKLSKKELKGEYVLFIALLEMEEHGECEFDYDHEVGSKSRYGYRAPKPPPEWHEFSEIERSERKIQTLVDFNGEEMDSNLEFDEDNILQKTPFAKGEKEEMGYTGYMGNYGPEATHWYRVSALVICKRHKVHELLPHWEGDEEEEQAEEETETEGEEETEEAEEDDLVEVLPPKPAVSRPLNVRRVAVPVAGGKRKIVEIIDLTGDSD
ncbi:hypothetical protein B0T21DRAFT_411386 [Apiosordaria backusii]|uniref:Prolyl 4-hydroxylase alpha subunit Fe(2+) 2OG dioxygenase domain-containing protein n=1 Tax=Apiosordaria backusii TaxID=314023 RepID=A0AA40BL22_9PEZI|nr:hypothetical protein B0T21DRAFT_411386 [Apiosordaria backusii]